MGDGTTSVVVMAAELLKRGADLVRSGVHPTSVIAGYRLAAKEGVRFINESLAIPVAALGEGVLVNVAATTMASKVVGGADGAAFARIVVDALLAVRREGIGGGSPTYPVKGVTILKAAGGAMGDSRLVRGVALAASRCAQGMPTRVTPARIACLDMNLQKARMHMGVSVVVTDPKELEAIREREATIARDRVRALLDGGATVVLTTKGIDDLCAKYFVEAGALAARRVPKDDLKRVARATGATIVSTLADDSGGETFDPTWLGTADEVVEENVAGDDVLVIRSGVVANGGAAAAAVAASPSAANEAKAAAPASTSPSTTTTTPPSGGATIILRGANDYLLDEMERAVHDALCAVRRVLECGAVVPGGGAVEAGLSVHLESFATSLGSREQLAIAEAAEAVLAVPKALAVNAARDGADLVAKLRAYHAAAQTQPGKAKLARSGLDLEAGAVRDSVEAGVLEPAISKVNALRFAAEAAITVLRVDDLIRVAATEEDEG